MGIFLTQLRPGTLVDTEIEEAARNDELIVGDFEPQCVRQACYELRASDVYYDLAMAEADRRRVLAPGDNGFLLGPRRYVVVIVKETIDLPPDMLGRIMTKGQLMSLGVLPVNTYADPGFRGRLGITLFNGSNRYIWIKPGEPIAKIEFAKLPRQVRSPYYGQHGYETNIWPYPVQLYATESQLHDIGIEAGGELEIELSHGAPLANLARKVDYYEKRVWVQFGILILSFAVLFTLYGQLPLLASVGIGLVTNLATQGLLWRRGRRR